MASWVISADGALIVALIQATLNFRLITIMLAYYCLSIENELIKYTYQKSKLVFTRTCDKWVELFVAELLFIHHSRLNLHNINYRYVSLWCSS